MFAGVARLSLPSSSTSPPVPADAAAAALTTLAARARARHGHAPLASTPPPPSVSSPPPPSRRAGARASTCPCGSRCAPTCAFAAAPQPSARRPSRRRSSWARAGAGWRAAQSGTHCGRRARRARSWRAAAGPRGLSRHEDRTLRRSQPGVGALDRRTALRPEQLLHQLRFAAVPLEVPDARRGGEARPPQERRVESKSAHVQAEACAGGAVRRREVAGPGARLAVGAWDRASGRHYGAARAFAPERSARTRTSPHRSGATRRRARRRRAAPRTRTLSCGASTTSG